MPTLDALCVAGRRPQLVVSQPTRPAGRGGRPRPPAVVERAAELGLDVTQPESVRETAFLDELRALAPDWAVVVAYGQIFRHPLLELPARGCVNVHASLLPSHRGAAPIQAAIAAGESETGVSVQLMDEGLDTGPVALRRTLGIGPDETAPELSERLARLGGEALVDALVGLESGALVPEAQDAARASWAPRLTRDDGRVDWTLPARTLYDRLRAYTPWPGLWAEWGDEHVKILACEPGDARDPETHEPPGTILASGADRIQVRCGAGSRLALIRLQRPGRKPTTGAEFLGGARLAVGDLLA